MRLDRVVTFLLTKNVDACIRFYRDTLGFTFLRDDGFALVFDAYGTMLRIGKMPDFTPAQNTVLGWEVGDIGAAVGEFARKGVIFERYPNMGQDRDGIANSRRETKLPGPKIQMEIFCRFRSTFPFKSYAAR